jgi:ERCC4-type nuclease
MSREPPILTIAATKPRGRPARMLAEMGVAVVPVEEDEGNVDRYVVSKRLAIERRTGASFLRGIQDKTLFTSAIYLREHFRLPILIVEGEVDYQYSAFDPQAVRGALSSMVLLYGLSVLATPDLEETVALIAMMARHEQAGVPAISLIPKRKATDLADLQRRVVEMLPGCGMVMARDLLQHFGSVRRVLNATEEELGGARGVGAQKAAQIHRVVNAEYESIDTERYLEDAIEAEPRLLFHRPVTLIARQHCIYIERGERHVVDLVFLDRKANELVLVELKRGRIVPEHYQQIRRYLDNAHRSRLLRPLLEKGARVRGMLATVEECAAELPDAEVSVCLVDRKRCVEVLKRLRKRRLGSTRGRGRNA